LETKNEALEQKQSSLTQAQMEASRLSGELSDMREQLKVYSWQHQFTFLDIFRSVKINYQ
jgi:hypothetical protein